jgi:hypothetical protein
MAGPYPGGKELKPTMTAVLQEFVRRLTHIFPMPYEPFEVDNAHGFTAGISSLVVGALNSG